MTSRDATGTPIALIGIGCRFPGDVTDAAGFWRLLTNGVDAITRIPADRIDLDRFYDPAPATPGRMMTTWGGFLDRIQDFDAGFFGISPREAERLDPQQRLLLETAWEALEDAGQDVTRLEGTPTGVFVGQWLSDFEARLFADPEAVDFYMTTGSGRYAASGRISYALGLRGPSLTIDTACSSSLAAVHLAVRSVRSGESTMALAGGVNVILQPHISVAYSQSRMMAPDGRCKFGDAGGDGYVRSEGAGIVVLKALDRALADGDRIYAVIRGSAMNNDGRSSGSMGTPSRIGQEELLRAAYRDAGVPACRVRYVEAHGTGTRAGDPVELGALGVVLGEGREPGQRAFVGSVKTNIGHTEGAAGVAGLIKAALALHHGSIPPSLHCREPNPTIPWSEMPFEVPRGMKAWPDGDGPRFAGVSAFGIAGTNAHVVLEEAPAAPASSNDGQGPAILPLSARSGEALRQAAARLADMLGHAPAPSLEDVCWTAAARRTPLEHRAVFVASDRAGMVDALRRYGEGSAASAEGRVTSEGRPRIAFMLPGQGAQWTGMARELMAREPVFLAALRKCDAAARPFADWSIVEQLQLQPDDEAYRLAGIDVIQPVLVALAIAYSDWWRSMGVEPDAVVGHSMGEVGAAYIAGVLDLEQAMRIVCRRSALMRRTSGRGAMALVELSMDEARHRVRGHEGRLSVAVSNSPRSSVISGDPDAVQEVLSALERDQVFCRLVKVDVASHSPQMEPLAAELAAELAGLVPAPARIPIYSTVLGRHAEGAEFDASYWARNLRQPVLFTDAVSGLLEDDTTIFVELGPHPILLPSVQQTAQARGRDVTTIACGRRDEPEQASLLCALGGVWSAAYPLDWRCVMPRGGRPVALPAYPWQRERLWLDAANATVGGSGTRASVARPDDESLSLFYQMRWQLSGWSGKETSRAERGQRWLVIGEDASAAAPLAAALTQAGVTATRTHRADLRAVLDTEHAASEGSLDGMVVVAGVGPGTAFLPLETLQALTRLEWRSSPRLWFVTTGSQPVSPGPAEALSVDQAALWGAARVVAEEHPDLWGGLVDLDPAASASVQVAMVARHLLDDGGEDQVALRGDQRYALRLAPHTVDSSGGAFEWRPDSAYLITGGLGDIGLRIARAMAAAGARRLILIGRTPLPPREQWADALPGTAVAGRIAAVRALEAAGVAVHLAPVDVGNAAEVEAFLARYAAEAWPPIRGVVHAVGAFRNQLAGTMDRAEFEAVVGPKLRGAQILDSLLPDLDLFVLFSSTGAFLAQPGQANYAAANAGLDALAHDRRARGRAALSIGWGVWENTGLVRGEAGERGVSEMIRQGIRPLSPERATTLFCWLCGRAEGSLAVVPVDWGTFRRTRPGRRDVLFNALTADHNIGLRPEVGMQLAHASPAERRVLLDKVVRDAVGGVLKIVPARLDPRKALGSLGLNSLMAMELRNRLEAALGRSLSATIAWNHPTIAALVTYLAGDESAASPRPATTPAGQHAGDLAERVSQVASLSDEEAAQALRRRQPKT